ncbi:MAG: tetratricopeptide repeat protein [Nitrospirae bacterium]|nr:tetratricopeptide repeat protein [Nitrospirota bacterium]
MEKGKLLEPADKAEEELKVMSYKLRVTLLCLLITVYSLLSACALPRLVILKDPLTPEEHINLGVAYEKKGEYDEAIDEYKKAAKKNPIALLYIGNVYSQKREMEKAEEYYKKAIDRDPLMADAYNNLAWLYAAQGKKLDEAEGLAMKAIELRPDRSDLYKDTIEEIRRRQLQDRR